MEIAIVGAGPVGIFFANLLLNNGHQVTLVESGNLHEESELLSRRNYLFESPSSLPNGVHKIGGGALSGGRELVNSRMQILNFRAVLKVGLGLLVRKN